MNRLPNSVGILLQLQKIKRGQLKKLHEECIIDCVLCGLKCHHLEQKYFISVSWALCVSLSLQVVMCCWGMDSCWSVLLCTQCLTSVRSTQ